MASVTRFTAELWRWEARADSWWFVTLPPGLSAAIADVPRPPSGFGSVGVQVSIGGSSWRTSVFPDSGKGGYVLPVKKAIRLKEGIGEGEVVTVDLEVIDGHASGR